MKALQELEQKIRNSIPELKEEFEAFEDGSIDRDMITPIILNHCLYYLPIMGYDFNYVGITESEFKAVGNVYFNEDFCFNWNLKSAYLKDQSEELINFLNELK